MQGQTVHIAYATRSRISVTERSSRPAIRDANHGAWAAPCLGGTEGLRFRETARHLALASDREPSMRED